MKSLRRKSSRTLTKENKMFFTRVLRRDKSEEIKTMIRLFKMFVLDLEKQKTIQQLTLRSLPGITAWIESSADKTKTEGKDMNFWKRISKKERQRMSKSWSRIKRRELEKVTNSWNRISKREHENLTNSWNRISKREKGPQDAHMSKRKQTRKAQLEQKTRKAQLEQTKRKIRQPSQTNRQTRRISKRDARPKRTNRCRLEMTPSLPGSQQAAQNSNEEQVDIRTFFSLFI